MSSPSLPYRRPDSRCRPIARATVCLLLAAVAAHAKGPNLLSNSNFAVGTAGWTSPLGGAATWHAADWQGNPRSGSLEAAITAGHYNARFQQCVPVVAGTAYVLAGSVYVDPIAPPIAEYELFVLWYPDGSCAGAQIGGPSGTETSVHGAWQRIAATMQAPAGASSALVVAFALRNDPAAAALLRYFFDGAYFGTGRCAPGPTTLCLNDDRFRVRATWTTPDSQSGAGMAVPFAGDSGSFWFFAPTNIELDVKVLDGCAINGRYWVFAAGLTNVQVALQVFDTETTTLWEHLSPQGTVFQTVTDTGALPTCP